MIGPTIFAWRAARRAWPLVIVALLVSGLSLATGARPASAAPADVLLQAPLIGQQFSPADPSGDAGAYDCLPASLTMAISVLQSTTLAQASGVGTYVVVRDGSRFAAGETVTVDAEKMIIRSIAANKTLQGSDLTLSADGTSVLDVARGMDGTAVVVHPAGTLVQRPADFALVRRSMRATSGVQTLGLGQTYGVVETSTDHLFTADKTYRPSAPDQWKSLVETELDRGRPLVLYIIDATKLDDSAGQAPRPGNESFTGSHAVLLVGLLDGGNTVVIYDPWNEVPGAPGRQFRMTADGLAAAWGNTRTSNGRDYPGAGWNYVGFYPTSTATVPPEPIVTPTTTPTPTPPHAPQLKAPAAPINLTDHYVGLGSCRDVGSFTCPNFTIAWSPGGGVATGYRVYVGAVNPMIQGMTVDCARDPLDDLALEATVSGQATSYTLKDDYSEVGHKCVAVVAFNAAGDSPRAAATPDATTSLGQPPDPTAAQLKGTRHDCPDGSTYCLLLSFSWRDADPQAAFRIYDAETGGGNSQFSCDDVFGQRSLLATTAVGATSWSSETEIAVGGGIGCSWVEAFNSAGTSKPVAFRPAS